MPRAPVWLGVTAALALLAKASAGLADEQELAFVDWSLPSRIEAALMRYGLDVDPQRPLACLSSGERTRAGLAALAFTKADFLPLDEPTNHLDLDALQALETALIAYDGTLLIVSHDEAFLERLGLNRSLAICSNEFTAK